MKRKNRISIILAVTLFIGLIGFVTTIKVVADEDSKLIKNGDFQEIIGENGEIRNWGLFTGNADAKLISMKPAQGIPSNQALIVHISKKPTEGRVVLHQNGIKLRPNNKYKISFDAKSLDKSGLDVSFIRDEKPNTEYTKDRYEFDLTSRWENYSREFTTTDFGNKTVEDARLRFILENNREYYFFDNIVLEDLGPPEEVEDNEDVPEPPITEPIETTPGVPTFDQIENSDGDGNYLVSWNTENAGVYRLQEKHENKGFSLIAKDINRTSVQISDREPGRWCYRVRVINQEGWSDWATTTCTIVYEGYEPPVVPEPPIEDNNKAPAIPEFLPIDIYDDSGNYTVSWKQDLNVDVYRIQERHNGNGFNLIGKDIRQNQISFSAKDPGEWCYRVRAINQAGWSDWSEIACTVVDDYIEELPPEPSPVPTPEPPEQDPDIPSTIGEVSIPINKCTHYVATNGSDFNGNGKSLNNAWRSIQKGIDSVGPGDVLCIKGGSYKESITIRNVSGTSSNPIMIGAYKGGGVPVVDGNNHSLPDSKCKEKDSATGRSGPGGRSAGRDGCRFDPIFSIINSQHVQIYGIEVKESSGRGIVLVDSKDMVLKGIASHSHWNMGLVATSSSGTKTTRLLVDESSFYNNIRARPEKGLVGGSGVAIVNGVSDSVFKNSKVYRNFGEGMDVGRHANNILVQNNMFWDNSHTNLYNNDAVFAVFDSNISFCTDQRPKWHKDAGIQAKPSYGIGITLRNENHSDNARNRPAGKQNEVTNNIVVGCRNNIVIASQKNKVVQDSIIANNTLVNARKADNGEKDAGNLVVRDGAYKKILIANNLIYQTDSSADAVTGSGLNHNGVTLKNNIVTKNSNLGKNINGFNAFNTSEIKMVNPTTAPNANVINANDYKVTAGSAVKDAGMFIRDVEELAKDYFGKTRDNKPDVGAYEL